MTDRPYNLIVILGPTASGKTRLAVRLAADLGTEIISADSRQVFRGMDIGTGKDLEEYHVDGKAIVCHLIDVADPDHLFSVFEFQQSFYALFRNISSRGMIPILVGGTGLYIESVLREFRMQPVPENTGLRDSLSRKSLDELQSILLGLKPDLHNTTDLTERARLLRAIEIAEHEKSHPEDAMDRPLIKPVVIGIHWDRKILRERITARLRERLAQGMVDEVQRLHVSGVSWERLNEIGLEYRYVSRYLQGEITYDEMFETLNVRIRQFAKRQDTWFRGMERRGIKIHWIEGNNYNALKQCFV